MTPPKLFTSMSKLKLKSIFRRDVARSLNTKRFRMQFEGQNISITDALFVDNVTGDLENWRIKSEAIERVLVFPPVNNYHRFLIHKVRLMSGRNYKYPRLHYSSKSNQC